MGEPLKRKEPPYEHWEKYFDNYSPPPPEKLRKWMTRFAEEIFCRLCRQLDLNSAEYRIDAFGLREALIRTDKRFLHYRIYHNGMKMDEKKRLAEFCYWMIRLNVITIKKGGSILKGARISAEIVICFVEAFCREQKYVRRVLRKESFDYLVYTLAYRELSREILVLLTEGLIAEASETKPETTTTKQRKKTK